MNYGWLVPGCETPGQSLAAGAVGGLTAGVVGLAANLGVVAVVALAVLVAASLDIGAHLLRRDPQFEAALSSVRQ